MDDNVDELHAGDHELDLEGVRVGEVDHERLEAVRLPHLQLEVVEGGQDDLVAALHQADGRQQLQHERLRPQLLVHEAEGDRLDGPAMNESRVFFKIPVYR